MGLILQLKQDLAKFKSEKKELELKIKRVFMEMQNNITPYFTDYRQIKAEELEQSGDELLELKTKLGEVEEKIIEIESQL